MNARLFVLSGADLGRSFALADGAVLGRSPECAVPLRDASISRMHAKVVARGESLWLVDQGSRNGLWSKTERVKELELADLSEFKVGDVLVRVRLELAAAVHEADVDFDVAPRVRPTSTAPKPVPPAAARAELELEEIVLEEAPEPARPAVSPAPAASRPAEPTGATGARPPTAPRLEPESRPDPASTSFRALGATKVAPALENRGQRVLQYHKVDARGSALSADLEQRPVWVKLLLVVLAMALCAAISWLAFRGTTFLRERASPDGDAPAGTAPAGAGESSGTTPAAGSGR
ncbi:MAG: FHA domain-containing protein [Planctomycetes bacterium]|nr:FHA domain-containing protein [Planctomycetota bacterium]